MKNKSWLPGPTRRCTDSDEDYNTNCKSHIWELCHSWLFYSSAQNRILGQIKIVKFISGFSYNLAWIKSWSSGCFQHLMRSWQPLVAIVIAKRVQICKAYKGQFFPTLYAQILQVGSSFFAIKCPFRGIWWPKKGHWCTPMAKYCTLAQKKPTYIYRCSWKKGDFLVFGDMSL
jgi:hypothetical protein